MDFTDVLLDGGTGAIAIYNQYQMAEPPHSSL